MTKEKARTVETEQNQPEGTQGEPAPGAGNGGAAPAQEFEQAVVAEAVGQLEAEVAELRDRLLRALAENENVRRRAERDRREAADFGSTRLARDLLAVYDNFERALSHADEEARAHAGPLIEGIELTRRELLNAFAKHRIEMFAPGPGDRFDPHLHQAMYEAAVAGAEPGTVIEVIQAGFTIAGRLLRPALVGVAKAPASVAQPDAAPHGQDG
jgi:molecular chaperone GrpE